MKIRKTIGSVVASLGLAVGMSGLAGATSGGMIDGTGYRSHNTIRSTVKQTTTVKNKNNVGVGNLNLQYASSGNATVQNATNGGDATTGDASNSSTTSVTGTVSNSGGGSAALPAAAPESTDATIQNTGAHSYNSVSSYQSSKTTVKNTNNVGVINVTAQGAVTGDATVQNVTNGGSATTGSASNTSSTTVDLSVSN